MKDEGNKVPKKRDLNGEDPKLVIVQHPIEGNLVLLKTEKESFLNNLKKK
jgi:hypothetical protein